jgi:hypothetical protein
MEPKEVRVKRRKSMEKKKRTASSATDRKVCLPKLIR